MWNHVANSLFLRQSRQRRYTFITVVTLSVLLLAFFVGFAAFSNDEPALPSLKFINVVFRHGARTPTGTYPTDPHKNFNWLNSKGALTNSGKKQSFELGEIFQKRYGTFLGKFYAENEVSIESSYAPQCQMSAMTFLAGLFPPTGHQIWNSALLWQPVPVNPIPSNLDNKIAAEAKCKTYYNEKRLSDHELHASLPYKDKEIFSYLTEHTGEPIRNLSQAEILYNILKIQSENSLELPKWTEKVFPTQLANLAAQYLASFTRTDRLKRLQAGPMIKDWIKNINDHKRDSKKKAFFYSGHDLTVVSLMRTLGFDQLDIPETCAAVITEYHDSGETGEDGFIQVFYLKTNDEKKINHMKLPFCGVGGDCPFSSFVKQLTKFVPENWESECKNV